MLSLLITLWKLYKGYQYAKTVQPYAFGPPNSAQAYKSHCIFLKSLGWD